MRNLQSICFLISVAMDLKNPPDVREQTEPSVRRTIFELAVGDARRYWALIMADGPYPQGGPNLHVQETFVEYLRLYLNETEDLRVQLRVYCQKEMVLVTASIALPEPTRGIASGMTDIHVYSSFGKLELFPDLYTALLPSIFELSIFQPATSLDLDNRNITIDHQTGESIGERFETHFRLTGPALQAAWAEGRRLMNKWSLGVIVGRDPDEAAFFEIERDIAYGYLNQRTDQQKIGKSQSYVDPNDAKMMAVVREGLERYILRKESTHVFYQQLLTKGCVESVDSDTSGGVDPCIDMAPVEAKYLEAWLPPVNKSYPRGLFSTPRCKDPCTCQGELEVYKDPTLEPELPPPAISGDIINTPKRTKRGRKKRTVVKKKVEQLPDQKPANPPTYSPVSSPEKDSALGQKDFLEVGPASSVPTRKVPTTLIQPPSPEATQNQRETSSDTYHGLPPLFTHSYKQRAEGFPETRFEPEDDYDLELQNTERFTNSPTPNMPAPSSGRESTEGASSSEDDRRARERETNPIRPRIYYENLQEGGLDPSRTIRERQVSPELDIPRTVRRVGTPTPPCEPGTPYLPGDLPKEPVGMVWECENPQVKSTSTSVDIDQRPHRSSGQSEAKRKLVEPRRDRGSRKPTQDDRRQTSSEHRKERSTGYNESADYEVRFRKTAKSTHYPSRSDDRDHRRTQSRDRDHRTRKPSSIDRRDHHGYIPRVDKDCQPIDWREPSARRRDSDNRRRPVLPSPPHKMASYYMRPPLVLFSQEQSIVTVNSSRDHSGRSTPASLPDFSQPPPSLPFLLLPSPSLPVFSPPPPPPPLPLLPPPPPPVPIAVVAPYRNPGLSREVLMFYLRLTEIQLEAVRKANPLAVNLTKEEITRRLALDDDQLNQYYGLPSDVDGEWSREMVDFVTTLTVGVVDLFCG